MGWTSSAGIVSNSIHFAGCLSNPSLVGWRPLFFWCVYCATTRHYRWPVLHHQWNVKKNSPPFPHSTCSSSYLFFVTTAVCIQCILSSSSCVFDFSSSTSATHLERPRCLTERPRCHGDVIVGHDVFTQIRNKLGCLIKSVVSVCVGKEKKIGPGV